jgi:hypothetical protein
MNPEKRARLFHTSKFQEKEYEIHSLLHMEVMVEEDEVVEEEIGMIF